MTPEQQARREIDAKLVAAGWLVQDRRHQLNLHAGPGVALCETDVEGEDHLFLDPIKRKDVLLVTYAPDGSMQPRPKVTAWEEKRVRRTAECFGLNDFPNLTDARRQV